MKAPPHQYQYLLNVSGGIPGIMSVMGECLSFIGCLATQAQEFTHNWWIISFVWHEAALVGQKQKT